MKLKILAGIAAMVIYIGTAQGAEKIRISVSNYNLSTLTVGVAQTKDFIKQEGIEAEIIR